jgi:methyl-accepting chemotaxis protein
MEATRFGRGIAAGSDTEPVVSEALTAARADLGSAADVSIAVVMCSPEYDLPTVLDTVQSGLGDVPLIGSTTAGEFTDQEVTDGGVVVALISAPDMAVHTSLATGASVDVFDTAKNAVEGLPDPQSFSEPHTTAITFHNGLAGKGEELTLVTRQLLGTVPLVGGSAADNLELDETTVFTDEGISTDGIAIALLAHSKPFGMAANHGHTALSEPYQVTNATENTVFELAGEPAFDVWKEEIEEMAAQEYGIDVNSLGAADDAFAILLTQFELGLETDAGGYKIRWPAMTDSTDGPLKFATGVPEGSDVRVMHSPKPEQISSARDAAAEALDSFEGSDVAGALVFDCVCRGLILGDEFRDAVNGIADEIGAPLAGLETYGEISMPKDATSGYHNTTTSVLVIPA